MNFFRHFVLVMRPAFKIDMNLGCGSAIHRQQQHPKFMSIFGEVISKFPALFVEGGKELVYQ
jgi:hypothetical protein